MSKRTELLLQIAAICVMVYFGWMIAQTAILFPWQERSARMIAEQALQQCRSEKVGK